MISISVDSCADLSQSILDHYKIGVMRYNVIFGEENFKDGLDITPPEIFQRVEITGTLPKTAAPSIIEFADLYQSLPGDVIHFTISSRLSAGYQNAYLASQLPMDKKVVVIDSANLSTGIGLLAIRAAELRNRGFSLDDIVAAVIKSKEFVSTSFVIDQLDYLHKGGRCSNMDRIAASLLKIHPVIEVQTDGTLGVKEKLRGNRKKCLDYLIDDFRQRMDTIDLSQVFITHTGCDEDANYISSELKKFASIKTLDITTAGATVSSHCGPNTIGILFFRNQ